MRFSRWWWPTVLALIALAAISCSDTGDDPQAVSSVTRTERLEIVGSDGITRAVLTTLEDGRPSLTMIDAQGRNRVWLFLSSDDGSPNLILIDKSRIVLMDGAGEIRSALRLDDTGSPIFSSMDANGSLRTLLRLTADGSPVTELYDQNGAILWSAP